MPVVFHGWFIFDEDAMKLITDTTLGADTANFDFTSIPGTYKHLMFIFQGRSDRVSTEDRIAMRFNNISTAVYDSEYVRGRGVTADAAELIGDTRIMIGTAAAASSTAGFVGQAIVNIPNYAGTTWQKQSTSTSTWNDSAATGRLGAEMWVGDWNTVGTAITRITIFPAVGTNWKTGSRCSLYGIS